MQQGGFAAAAATHDDEDLTALDAEIEVTLDNEITVRHGEVLHDNDGIGVHSLLRGRHFHLRFPDAGTGR